jgi:hypothetical protein
MKRSLMAEVNSDKNIKDRKWKKLNINNGVNIYTWEDEQMDVQLNTYIYFFSI